MSSLIFNRMSRAATSSLTDLEMKLNKAIEKSAILEHEILAKDNLTEQVQRLRDELNGKNDVVLTTLAHFL